MTKKTPVLVCLGVCATLLGGQQPAEKPPESRRVIQAAPLIRPGASPQAGVTSRKADTLDAKVAAIEAEYEAAYAVFVQEYRGAKDDEARAEVARTKMPKGETYAPRMAALAESAPKDEAAARAWLWILTNCYGTADYDKALNALFEHHILSPRMGQVAELMGSRSSAAVRSKITLIFDKSPHREVRGRCLLAFADNLKEAAELARAVKGWGEDQRKGYESWAGSGAVAELEGLKADEAEAECITHLERVVAEFADVKAGRGTLGERASGALFEMRNLAVGKPAPEIEGEDLDGVKFKLSDYRGKVVFLDFWGHW